MVWLMAAFLPAWGAHSVERIDTVLRATRQIEVPSESRLPLYILPISGQLDGVADGPTVRDYLEKLRQRGIAYSVNWRWKGQGSSPDPGTGSILKIARLQHELGMQVVANASSCLYSFHDGSEPTLHVDADGRTFGDDSFGRTLGCPFGVDHRIPGIRNRVQSFVSAYRESEVPLDFVFVDWEVDGPIEWNGAWESSRRCIRCREAIPEMDSFISFQQAIREKRSALQKQCLSDPVLAVFPEAMVGNYGVNPHDGYRYWYDYFELVPENPAIPVVREQKAVYRPWADEFDACGYTVSMPVIYTWYPVFEWYDYDDPDSRWFYNLLRIGSNAGAHTSPGIPSVPYVHWHTTAPPEHDPDASLVTQFSRERYAELLRHLLVRGHDSFFLWCLGRELETEISLLHKVYAESHQHAGILNSGQPFSLTVPVIGSGAMVVSGVHDEADSTVLIIVSDFDQDRGNSFPMEVELKGLPGTPSVIVETPGRFHRISVGEPVR